MINVDLTPLDPVDHDLHDDQLMVIKLITPVIQRECQSESSRKSSLSTGTSGQVELYVLEGW